MKHILQDLNFDLLKKKETWYIKKYKEFFCQMYGLKQVINQPTLITENSATLLDHVLANSKDRISQYTNVGIHKDDIVFEMDEYPIKKIGSQGQQKSFLIALKLAQFDFMQKQMGFKPILLLDDIFDKLDDKRVEKIIAFANDGLFGQVFITDTHKQRTEEILNTSKMEYNLFEIKNGEFIK